MTHLTLLHLPCFSHSRLMRLEAAITFIEHIYLRMLIVHLTMFWKHSIHTSSFRVRTKPKALSRYTHYGITHRVNYDNPCTLIHHLESISAIPSTHYGITHRVILTYSPYTSSLHLLHLDTRPNVNLDRCGFRISKYGNRSQSHRNPKRVF